MAKIDPINVIQILGKMIEELKDQCKRPDCEGVIVNGRCPRCWEWEGQDPLTPEAEHQHLHDSVVVTIANDGTIEAKIP